MTPHQTKTAISVMQAYVDDPSITFDVRPLGSTEWVKVEGDPSWDWDNYEYRVFMPCQIEVFTNHLTKQVVYNHHIGDECFDYLVRDGWAKRKFREVLE